MVLDRIQKCLPFLPLKKSSKFGNYSIAFEGMPRHPNQKESKEIRKSWRKIELDAAKLGIQVFVGMFERFPEIQASFSKIANVNKSSLSSNIMLHAHSLHIMHMIGTLINLLEEPENLLSKLIELGERHFERKADEDLLQYFCPAYVEALARKGQWRKKTIQAWEVFFEFIKAAMIHGLQKRRAVFNNNHSHNCHHISIEHYSET